MKQLVCEMCGSTELIKQDGVFVCQFCGCKYSVEEARKMMIEGTVDIQGTVKIDSSDELKNLYELARRAKETNNNENASKYYDMILLKDPTSWEANFYSVYFKSMGCKIAEIAEAATAVNNCIESTLRLIKKHIIDSDEKKRAVKEVCENTKLISDMLFQSVNSWMQGIDPRVKDNFAGQYINAAMAAGIIPATLCDNLIAIFEDDDEIMSSIVVDILKNRMSDGIGNESERGISYINAIKKYEPGYEPPQFKPTTVKPASSVSSNGCYVATCVYGSYDCPQVWTLRRFRDDTLGATWYGRAFIRTYYAISPTLVKWFGKTTWFKKMWHGTLNKMVSYLNNKGVADTPYQDKDWR